MTAQHYTAAFTVAQSPELVFAAVTNPRAWWGGGNPNRKQQNP